MIVTADHGEGLGDHGQQFHGTDLYEGQTHVPLVIAGPGIAARRIAETVGLVDLVPTIVDLAGYRPPAGPSLDGRSVADLATGHRLAATESGTAFLSMPGADALVQGGWKYIERGVEQELYDVRADPGERSNQVSVRLDIANRLRRALASKQRAAKASPF